MKCLDKRQQQQLWKACDVPKQQNWNNLIWLKPLLHIPKSRSAKQVLPSFFHLQSFSSVSKISIFSLLVAEVLFFEALVVLKRESKTEFQSTTMEQCSKESKVIPDSVMDSLKKSLYNVEQVKAHLLKLISLSDPDVLAEMPPLERAQSLFLVAKATTTLYTCSCHCPYYIFLKLILIRNGFIVNCGWVSWILIFCLQWGWDAVEFTQMTILLNLSLYVFLITILFLFSCFDSDDSCVFQIVPCLRFMCWLGRHL